MGKVRFDALSHTLIYDLSNPEAGFYPDVRFARPAAGFSVPQSLVGLHGLLSTGPRGNRVYFSNGTAQDGVLEIVDREKLLNGPKEPTDENLRYPVVGKSNFRLTRARILLFRCCIWSCLNSPSKRKDR